MSRADKIYLEAAKVTGKGVPQLHEMAHQVFATMLHHALAQRGATIWTVTEIQGSALYVEVNIPRRNVHVITGLRGRKG